MPAIVLTLTAGPSIVMLLWERRRPSKNRPVLWPARSTAISVPQAVGFGIAANELIDASWSWLVCLSALAQVVPAVMAGRSLRNPLSIELGELNIDVVARIRYIHPGLPRWALSDNVTLTKDEIVITLQLGPAYVVQRRLSLASVRQVEARHMIPRDNPWLILESGDQIHMSPGDVIAVRHGSGTCTDAAGINARYDEDLSVG
jgi:hypothetical protein